ncbi:hypothetical protein FZEAL_4084 [Fusarium zealandicum]|uniref:Carboxylic ester hydrolase n=1 Tax=Fusarium zealandicum TaxID=1053134 RepID=A0A8H4UNB8_9HYPO|nr:hypothetical protein FZEAL_4084 [Fusarium zealandicum]
MRWLNLINIIWIFIFPWNIAATKSPVVDLGYARYKGTRLAAGVDQFLGMRYAAPPTGNLRFRAPMRPRKERSVTSATEFGKTCNGVNKVPSDLIGEDCLFVNVFKPKGARPGSKLPVWLYFSGGGYRANSNSNYNGTRAVVDSGMNVIFVNFNYRVGPFGFLAGRKVQRDGDLNVGLLDQQRLLWWVRGNIASFGGDPNHVVLHGTSAGAGSIAHQMTAYGGRNDHLFAGVGLQSPFWPTIRTVAESEFQIQHLAKAVGCPNNNRVIACLRSVPEGDLIAAARAYPFPGATASPLPHFYWLPVVDGNLIRGNLFELFDSGKFIKVPTLTSHGSNEGSMYGENATNPHQVQTFMKNNYPELTKKGLDKVIEAYPLMSPITKHNPWFPSASAAYGDRTFVCPGNAMAVSMARRYSSARVWNYRFNVLDPMHVEEGWGVPHAYDIGAILGPESTRDNTSYLSTNSAIVPVTMAYWTSFVRSLDPNQHRAAGSPYWKPWGRGDGIRLKLETNATELEPVPASLIRKCHMWEDLA